MSRTRLTLGALSGVLTALIVVAPPGSAEPGTAPGTVVDSAVLSASMRVDVAGAAQEFTYWSRGPREPMQSLGALYLPPGPPPPGGWPIVAYAHGTVGIADKCSFTRTPREYYQNTVYPALLEAGYAIVVSDYVGLGTPGTHPYLDGPSQARSVIDGVRAARALEPSLGTRWAVIGQSQGAQTSLFTAHLAGTDAPELELRGAAATGIPSSLEVALPLAGPWLPRLPLRRTTSYFALLLAGLRASAPELDIDSYLTPTGQDVLRIVESECLNEADAQVQDVAMGQMLRRPLDDPALRAAARAMMEVPTTGYTVPLFIGQGTADRDVPAVLTAELIGELLLAGTDLQVGVYPGDHIEAMRVAFPDVQAFLARVLASEPSGP